MINERRRPEEEKLWTAVLARAAEDACIGLSHTSYGLATQSADNKSILRGRAVAWFASKSEDFQLVCELAGRNPEYVYTTMMKRINAKKDYDPKKEKLKLKEEEELNKKDKKLRSLEQTWKHIRYLKYAQFFKGKKMDNIKY